ncbi:MAG: DMT family transporter [Paracoccaceae bacterium]
MPQPTLRDWLSIAALGLIWGGTFMVIALALRGYGPLTVATARTTLGALMLCVMAAAMRRPLPRMSRSMVTHLLLIGVCSTALPFFLLSWGQQSVPSAFAGLSMAAVPLFVLPLAHVFIPGEVITLRKGLGFSLGFAGVLVLLGHDAFSGGSGGLLPRLACVAAALCYAVSGISTRRCPPIDPIMLSALSLLIGSVALVPAMLVFEGLPNRAATTPTIAIIFLGLVPTAFATLLRVRVIRSAGPSFMTLTNYQVPLWSVAFGALVLDESLSPNFWLALGAILTGLAISQYRRR